MRERDVFADGPLPSAAARGKMRVMRIAPCRPLETTWEDWLLGGGAQASFEKPGQPLEVEIGPGEDAFLLEQALRRPDTNWLGIEYSRKRIQRQARMVLDRAGPLGNLRLIWRPAGDLVGPFLSPRKVRAYHVYFPDPWPKKHHHRFRLLDPHFLGELERSLEVGGDLLFLTDHLPYAEAVLEAVLAVPGLGNTLPPPGFETLGARQRSTVFEARWRAAGHDIYGLHLRAGAAGADPDAAGTVATDLGSGRT